MFYVSGIAEGAQFAVVGILQGIFLAILGWPVYRALLLPFLFLWLMVPTGEFLLPLLQEITAGATAALLDLVRIPVFRDGLLIEVPTGSYLIAPGCAGLNFLLASLALSVAFAELSYRDWSRRLLFILALLALAVAGNIVRVFLIIGIAHLSGNIGNIVDDHLLYGWGFFSLLMFAAMTVGHRFRQDTPPAAPDAGPSGTWVAGRLWFRFVLLLVCVGAVPFAVKGRAAASALPAVAPELTCGGFVRETGAESWVSHREWADSLSEADCLDGSRRIHVVLAALDRPLRQGKLLGLEHRLIDDVRWNLIGRRAIDVSVDGGTVPVLSESFESPGHRRLIWSLRWVDGAWRRAGFDAAKADLLTELAGRRRSFLILLAVDDDDAAPDLLRAFLAQAALKEMVVGADGK